MIYLSEYQTCNPDEQIEEREEDLSCLFLKNGKKSTDLGKMCLDRFHIWLKFLILSTVFKFTLKFSIHPKVNFPGSYKKRVHNIPVYSKLSRPNY